MFLKIKKIGLILAIALIIPVYTQAATLGLTIDYNPKAFTSSSVSLNIDVIQGNNLPWNLEASSAIYKYKFKDFGFYDPSRLLKIIIKYPIDNKDYKQIYSYDNFAKIWRPLKSVNDIEHYQLIAYTNSTQGQVVVLSKPGYMTVGTASWYAYKGGDFAASPDFIKGSMLRVHNLDNDKFVDVTINDWGPERDKFPNRVIDLDRVAFSKIASPTLGLIRVKIEPIKIVKSAVDVNQDTKEPSISASSAVIMSADTGKILWEKNASKRSSIASLSKLIAIKVFLDTRPSFNKVVTYRYQDEKYNYRYVKPWESAKLRVKEGETMTIGDLVYSSLVGSANNTIETLVRVSGLSRDQFVARMNNFVWSLGVKSTHFVEPTGLSPENVSSAKDYAIITKEVFKNPLIKKVSSTYRYEFNTINTKKHHSLTNTDRLLRNNKYSIVASKTGYLDEAGHCLVTISHTNQGDIIAINLNSKSKDDNFLDNERLIMYGRKILKNRK